MRRLILHGFTRLHHLHRGRQAASAHHVSRRDVDRRRTQVVKADNQGSVTASVDLPPMCCPLSQSRRLSEDAAVASHRLQHVLRLCINSDQLCIQEVRSDTRRCNAHQPRCIQGPAAWHVHVDVCVLDSSGGFFDAALMASMAALQRTTLPAVDIGQEGRPVVRRGVPEGRQLQTNAAVACSVAWVEDASGSRILLLDPTAEALALAVATATLVVDAGGRVLYHASGGGCSTAELVASCKHCMASRLSLLPTLGISDC